ncbi:MAG: hypothetical protein ACK559_41270 [bacterium]
MHRRGEVRAVGQRQAQELCVCQAEGDAALGDGRVVLQACKRADDQKVYSLGPDRTLLQGLRERLEGEFTPRVPRHAVILHPVAAQRGDDIAADRGRQAAQFVAVTQDVLNALEEDGPAHRTVTSGWARRHTASRVSKFSLVSSASVSSRPSSASTSRMISRMSSELRTCSVAN